MAYVHNALYGQVVHSDITLELLWLTINMCSSDLTLGMYYQPPGSDLADLDLLFDSMCLLGPRRLDNIVLLGDFNIDHVCESPEVYSLSSIFGSF